MKIVTLFVYLIFFSLIVITLLGDVEKLIARILVLFKPSQGRSIYAIDHIGSGSFKKIYTIYLSIESRYRMLPIWLINHMHEGSSIVGFKRKLKHLRKHVLLWEANSLKKIKDYKASHGRTVYTKDKSLADAIGYKAYKGLLNAFDPLSITADGWDKYAYGLAKLTANANAFSAEVPKIEEDIKEATEVMLAYIDGALKNLNKK